jgi:hypothetical protein
MKVNENDLAYDAMVKAIVDFMVCLYMHVYIQTHKYIHTHIQKTAPHV